MVQQRPCPGGQFLNTLKQFRKDECLFCLETLQVLFFPVTSISDYVSCFSTMIGSAHKLLFWCVLLQQTQVQQTLHQFGISIKNSFPSVGIMMSVSKNIFEFISQSSQKAVICGSHNTGRPVPEIYPACGMPIDILIPYYLSRLRNDTKMDREMAPSNGNYEGTRYQD